MRPVNGWYEIAVRPEPWFANGGWGRGVRQPRFGNGVRGPWLGTRGSATAVRERGSGMVTGDAAKRAWCTGTVVWNVLGHGVWGRGNSVVPQPVNRPAEVFHMRPRVMIDITPRTRDYPAKEWRPRPRLMHNITPKSSVHRYHTTCGPAPAAWRHDPALCPVGTIRNSPGFQPWVSRALSPFFCPFQGAHESPPRSDAVCREAEALERAGGFCEAIQPSLERLG